MSRQSNMKQNPPKYYWVHFVFSLCCWSWSLLCISDIPLEKTNFPFSIYQLSFEMLLSHFMVNLSNSISIIQVISYRPGKQLSQSVCSFPVVYIYLSLMSISLDSNTCLLPGPVNMNAFFPHSFIMSWFWFLKSTVIPDPMIFTVNTNQHM